MVTAEPAKRLFFALWPTEAQRNALAGATLDTVRSGGGRPVPSLSLHTTLSFLGSVPERRIQDLGSIARRVAGASAVGAAPLLLEFDHIEYWKKPRILCVVAQGESPQVLALADALAKEAVGAGFNPDLKPFRPHVTLARKVSHPIPTTNMDPVVWRLTEFALVESRTEPGGSAYRVLASFPWRSEERRVGKECRP